MPKILQFSPRGKPGRPEESELSLDQFEALKLTDYQKFSQFKGAQAMRISRPSYGRILREARFILADAIVNGKTLKIRLGNAQIGVRKIELTCRNLCAELKAFEESHARLRKTILGKRSCGDLVNPRVPVMAPREFGNADSVDRSRID